MTAWAIPIAMAAASAYLGNEQQKAQDKARKDQALINMYAPLFGHAPQALGARQDMVTPALIQGGLSGYSIASQMDTQDKLNALYDAQMQKAQGTAAPGTSQPAEVFIPYAQPQTQQSVDPYRFQPRMNPQSFFNLYG